MHNVFMEPMRLSCPKYTSRLHGSGVEVLLDVVYNHTLEADDKDPYLVSFRGIENKTYYMTDTAQYTQLINWSGCGNTVNGELSVVSGLG